MVMSVFALATALGAQLRIPVSGTDVPLTLQTLAVMVTGLLLTPRLALGAMSLYLALGLGGIFQFATPTGLLGPTGGYLIGFLLAAPLMSLLVMGHRRNLGYQVVAVIAGTLLIFALGVAWRTIWLGGDVLMAMRTGLAPFIPEAVLKMAAASAWVQGGFKLADFWRKPQWSLYG
jgi:biotin transport system substrate-specific component